MRISRIVITAGIAIAASIIVVVAELGGGGLNAFSILASASFAAAVALLAGSRLARWLLFALSAANCAIYWYSAIQIQLQAMTYGNDTLGLLLVGALSALGAMNLFVACQTGVSKPFAAAVTRKDSLSRL